MVKPRKHSELRIQAVRELRFIEEEGAFAGLSRRRISNDLQFERRLTDLVSGVTRNRRWLNFLVDWFYTNIERPLERDVRIILRLGIYELVETRTPPHAAIHECVETGKQLIGPRIGGLINGILRTVDRSREDLPEPDTGDEQTDLAVRFSHPDWIVKRWVKRYGLEATEQFLKYNNQRPVFGIRVRGKKSKDLIDGIMELEFDAERSQFFDDYFRVRQMQPILNSGLFKKGKVLVQDEGAGGVIRALDPQPGENILDLCAAPGGKSFAIADLVGVDGSVTAVDKNESRLSMLEQEAKRLSLPQIRTVVADVLEIDDILENGQFDRVLVDAPCTGLGVLAKRADLRWRKDEESVSSLAKIQKDILRSAARHVRPGGVLVYSTCTTEPEENEEIADDFVMGHPGFARENLKDHIQSPLLTETGAYQSIPYRDKIDGAYAVRFRREL